MGYPTEPIVGRQGSTTTDQPDSKELVDPTSNDNGGGAVVDNKSGEVIVNLYADDYGNGVVGAYNRKGMDRTLQPRP